MGDYPDQHLDPVVAATYDDREADRFDPAHLDPCLNLLAELAEDGPVLELAIGTGRVALPLQARGLEVHGIDASQPMVDQMLAKPGADRIAVTIGDMTTTVVGSGFSLAYLVFNTIGNVTSQDGQLACFTNARAQLAAGGRFLIEVGVPKLASLAPGERIRVFAHEESYVGFDEYTDPVNQLFWSHHWLIGRDEAKRVSGQFRWVWPSELDLMARLAGMELEHRWADWNRSPFAAESPAHVSVWRVV